MSIEEILSLSSKKLASVSLRPRLESEILLAHFLGKDRIYLHLNNRQIIDEEPFFELIKLREQHIPIEYITKKVSFYSEDFYCDFGVLIPRPESEILVDIASDLITKYKLKDILEIGVGSGVISAMLKIKHHDINMVASDISEQALKIAKRNFELKNLDIIAIKSDLFEDIEDTYDIVISNPPYIKNSFQIDKNLTYEPQNALFGGESGEEIILKIIDGCMDRGVRYLVCEMGYDQRDVISQYLELKGIYNYNFYKDLGDLDRGFWVNFF